MSIDLIVSDSGKVMIASTRPFADDILRVNFDAATSQLSLAFAREDMADQCLDIPVAPRLTARVVQAPRILLVHIEQGCVCGGYDVPLTCIETV